MRLRLVITLKKHAITVFLNLYIQVAVIFVNEPDPLFANLTISNYNGYHISCFGESDGTVSSNPFGGTPPYSYSWSGPNGLSLNSVVINNLGPGYYDLQVSDSHNCIKDTTIFISEPYPLTFEISVTDPLCHNENTGSIALEVNGGTGPYTSNYENKPYTIVNDSMWYDSLYADPQVTITITDANGCTTTGDTTIHNPTQLYIVSHLETNPTCYGDADGSANIEVTGGTIPYKYSIDGWVTHQSSNMFTSLADGSYDYLVKDANNCPQQLSFSINDPAEITITADEIIHVACFGEATGAIDISVTNTQGGYQAIWPLTGTDSLSVSELTSGYHIVSVIDDNTCSRLDSFMVNQPDQLVVTFSTSDAFCFNTTDGSIDLDINGGAQPYSFLWSNGNTTEDATELLVGDYSCTIIDANNCKYNSQTISIDFYGPINCGDIILSPNLEDGINDVWAPYPLLAQPIEVIIFNRWGKEVFYHNKEAYLLSWDGKSNDGDELPSYDYYYIIKFEKDKPDETGVITLIR